VNSIGVTPHDWLHGRPFAAADSSHSAEVQAKPAFQEQLQREVPLGRHVKNIYAKLGLSRRAEALKEAIRLGLLQ